MPNAVLYLHHGRRILPAMTEYSDAEPCFSPENAFSRIRPLVGASAIAAMRSVLPTTGDWSVQRMNAVIEVVEEYVELSVFEMAEAYKADIAQARLRMAYPERLDTLLALYRIEWMAYYEEIGDPEDVRINCFLDAVFVAFLLLPPPETILPPLPDCA